MFGLGPWELILILLIVLVIFGAGRLPEIGANLGKGIKNFKKSVSDTEAQVKGEAPKQIEEKKDQTD
jgi:sec-independent protein translocase protein TatA